MSSLVPSQATPLDRVFGSTGPGLALVIAALVLAFFWQLGAAPLYDLDEGAFTEATREMIR